MITIHIPLGKTFDINSELMSARNIKDKVNRNTTIKGLLAIKQYI